MSGLPDPIGRALHVEVDELRLARGWRAIEAKRRRASLATATVVLAAAAALLLLWPASRGAAPDGALRARSGGGVGAVIAQDLTLDDGSSIDVADGAELAVVTNDAARFTVALRTGRGRFSVAPGGPRRWRVDAGDVSVEVVGTVFGVAREASGAVRVDVERGAVVVRSERVPGGSARLTAGERLVVPPVEPAPTAPWGSAGAGRPERARHPPAPEPSSPAPRERRTARRAAPSPPSPAAPPEDAEALLAAADAARRAGRIDDALALLDRASAREGEPTAAVASLTRGRLLLDRGRAAEAASDLERALRQGLPVALTEPTRARLVEARARAGDADGARDAAEIYRAAYPDGRWRERVDRWSEP